MARRSVKEQGRGQCRAGVCAGKWMSDQIRTAIRNHSQSFWGVLK